MTDRLTPPRLPGWALRDLAQIAEFNGAWDTLSERLLAEAARRETDPSYSYTCLRKAECATAGRCLLGTNCSDAPPGAPGGGGDHFAFELREASSRTVLFAEPLRKAADRIEAETARAERAKAEATRLREALKYARSWADPEVQKAIDEALARGGDNG